MNKHIVRFVAALLVPCLAGDPLLASVAGPLPFADTQNIKPGIQNLYLIQTIPALRGFFEKQADKHIPIKVDRMTAAQIPPVALFSVSVPVIHFFVQPGMSGWLLALVPAVVIAWLARRASFEPTTSPMQLIPLLLFSLIVPAAMAIPGTPWSSIQGHAITATLGAAYVIIGMVSTVLAMGLWRDMSWKRSPPRHDIFNGVALVTVLSLLGFGAWNLSHRSGTPGVIPSKSLAAVAPFPTIPGKSPTPNELPGFPPNETPLIAVEEPPIVPPNPPILVGQEVVAPEKPAARAPRVTTPSVPPRMPDLGPRLFGQSYAPSGDPAVQESARHSGDTYTFKFSDADFIVVNFVHDANKPPSQFFSLIEKGKSPIALSPLEDKSLSGPDKTNTVIKFDLRSKKIRNGTFVIQLRTNGSKNLRILVQPYQIVPAKQSAVFFLPFLGTILSFLMLPIVRYLRRFQSPARLASQVLSAA